MNLNTLSSFAKGEQQGLTETEILKINARSVPDSLLPKYYDALIRQSVPISRDFESFLILQDSVTKTQAITWLTTARQLTQKNYNRDQLLKECLDSEKSDLSSIDTELSLIMTTYTAFRSSFSESKLKDVKEVGMLLTDLQLSLGELGMIQDKLDHLKVLNSVLKEAIDNGEIDDERKKEIDSWLIPLTFYIV